MTEFVAVPIDLLERLNDALQLGFESTFEIAENYHISHKGYMSREHAQHNANVDFMKAAKNDLQKLIDSPPLADPDQLFTKAGFSRDMLEKWIQALEFGGCHATPVIIEMRSFLDLDDKFGVLPDTMNDEPAEYQWRHLKFSGEVFIDWSKCTKDQFENTEEYYHTDRKKVEVRRLYAHPPKRKPVAWVSPRAYGSQVTFTKPVKPANWDHADDGREWFCLPLGYIYEDDNKT